MRVWEIIQYYMINNKKDSDYFSLKLFLFKENIRKYIKMIKVVLSGGIIYDGWFEYFSL